MKNQNGYTLIEVLVLVALILVVAMVAVNFISGKNNDLSIGINGISETRCIGGYKFIIGEGGQARQVLNEQGGGIRCDQ
jgi:prepilin-type N-terminal cleavage/methylation domain-containing protein